VHATSRLCSGGERPLQQSDDRMSDAVSSAGESGGKLDIALVLSLE
jgi:hypothetical protein